MTQDPVAPDAEDLPAKCLLSAGRLVPAVAGGADVMSLLGARWATGSPAGVRVGRWPGIAAAAYLATGPLMDVSGR